MSRIVHPRMVEALQRDFFKQTCALKAPTKSRSTTGQEQDTYAVVTGYEAVPCRVAPSSGGERRTNLQVYSDTTHVISLAAQILNLTKEWRANVDGQDYLILRVSTEAEGAFTHLECRIVT